MSWSWVVGLLALGILYCTLKDRGKRTEVERGKLLMNEAVKCAQLAGFKYERLCDGVYESYMLRYESKYPLALHVTIHGWLAWNTLGELHPAAKFERRGDYRRNIPGVSDFQKIISNFELAIAPLIYSTDVASEAMLIKLSENRKALGLPEMPATPSI